jgi:hypothetical protein
MIDFGMIDLQMIDLYLNNKHEGAAACFLGRDTFI